MWFGTRGGLSRLDIENKSFINFREKDGLANEVINGILEDDHGNLWLSTNLGLSMFDTASHAFKNYDIHDGLQGNQFSVGACFKSESGTMLFGGTNGLSVFHSDSIFDNSNIPEVWITGLYIDSELIGVNTEGSPLKENISYTEQVVLSYKQKNLSFDFIALNYLAPSNNQYAYKLDGLDHKPGEWVNVGSRRTAYYTNIPPGEYVFQVKASNNDNLWNETGASLSIIVEPPFWDTIWFKLLVMMSVYGIAYAFFRLRMYRIKLQNRALEALVKERTSKVVQQKEVLSVQAENLRKANKSIVSKNIQLEENGEKIRIQAEEIYRMNELLKKDNIYLEENVKELSKARVMQKRVSFTEFKLIYPDIESCNQFLSELKAEKRYECKRCGNSSYSVNNEKYSRRCSKCGYNESVTVGTIFYRIKFPIDKAFYILYLVSMGRELTVAELAGLISLRRETCWAFRNKVMGVMKKRKRFKNPREGWKELILDSK
jgi:ribosomal protein L37E